MQRISRMALLCVGLCLVCSVAARAEHFILATDPFKDQSSFYQSGLLALALEHASGDHTIEYKPFRINQGRAFRELAAGAAAFNVIDSGYSSERESALTMVYVPLTRGLLGQRLLVVKRAGSAAFSAVRTFEDMRTTITFGSSPTWPDTAILRGAGLQVVTGEKDQLYSMLQRGRFLAYPRGLQEIMPELRHNNGEKGDELFAIESTAMLSYKFDAFFFTAPDDKRRAEIIEEGLLNAYKSGAFMNYFNTHPAIREGLDELKAHERKVFTLENPNLSERVKSIPDDFWHPFSD